MSKDYHWVTVATFDFPHQTLLLESRLEAAEIPYFLKDAYVAQTTYSLAVGGIKLQVPSDCVDEVWAIFQEIGLADRLPSATSPDIFEQLSAAVAHLPLLGRVPAQVRWLVLLVVCTLPFVWLLYRWLV
ncbi:MAG: hypothetical protein ACFCUI_13440 [Bernardetiaceae bacterium]